MSEGIPEKYRNDLGLIRETAGQVTRDLNMDGMVISFDGDVGNAFEELKGKLMPVVEKLFKDRQAFQSYLYRVDISERDYRKIISESSPDSLVERLTEQVLRREFQKVIIRRYFSEKKQ